MGTMGRVRWPAVLALLAACGCGVPEDTGRTAGRAREPAWTTPSVKGKGTGIAAAKVIRGAVTAVDADQGVVILNVGWRQGTRRDYAFIVYRGERYVGTVIVDALFPDLCGARYGADMQADPVAGDRIATKLLAP